MNVAIVLAIILAALFGLTYFTKRRFGVLGLALAAGDILSQLWAHDLTPIVRNSGFETTSPPLVSVVAVGLVLLPAVVLLFSGPVYKKSIERIVGAAAFALLALAFLLPILGDALVLKGDSATVYNFISTYREWIITAGLGFAVFDLLTIKSRRSHSENH